MPEEGIDVSGQQIKQLRQDMLSESKKIVVLCNRDICPNFLLQREGVIYLQVEDPYKKDIDETRKVRETIKQIVTNLAEQGQGK